MVVCNFFPRLISNQFILFLADHLKTYSRNVGCMKEGIGGAGLDIWKMRKIYYLPMYVAFASVAISPAQRKEESFVTI